MNKQDFAAFRRYLNGVFEQYGKPPLSDAGTNIMFQALSDLPLDVVLAGLSRHVQLNRYIPPNAASVREAVIGTPKDRATQAYGLALKALRRINSGESVKFDDPAIHYALQNGFGGWTGFAQANSADCERIFTKYYAAAVRLGKSWNSADVLEHLAGRRESRGSLLNPWQPDQVVSVKTNVLEAHSGVRFDGKNGTVEKRQR